MSKFVAGSIITVIVVCLVAVAVFASTAILMFAWNYVSSSFECMPRIGFWTALAMIFINNVFWSPLVVAINSNRKSK